MTDNFDPKVLGGSVKRGIVNPDLVEERKKCDFDQNQLSLYLFGEAEIKNIKGIYDWIERHPESISGREHFEQTREEKFKTWWKRYHAVMSSEDGHHYFTQNSQTRDKMFSWSFLFPGQSSIGLH